MVFFNCNACGEALKKNQVEKHTFRCRHCEVLSCVDCGKDFWGNDYQSHTKCMTEEEKYCGLGYVPKVNKGEAKQEQWIEKVQGAIEKAASNHGLKALLIRLKDYPNIPRKQQKFQNFLKNSLRVNNESLITQVWDILMTHTDQDKNKENTSTNVSNENMKVNNGIASKQETNGLENSTAHDKNDEKEDVAEPKKNKRERKEERRNKANKQEKKDCSERKEKEDEPVKKSKKRKHRDDDLEEQISEERAAVTSGVSENQPPKKKKKKKHASKDQATDEGSEEVNLEVTECDQPSCEEPETKKKEKFDWKKTITKVLEDKGEISLKKLRKKVLNEFSASGSSNYSEENLMAKFDKKVRAMPSVQVLKERAKLKVS